MKINEKWHGRNRMPKSATMPQRARWHIAHQENCGCRPIPEKVMRYIKTGKRTPKR